MPTETFPDIPIKYSLTHDIEYINFVADMGDGFEQRVNKNINWTHADGEGNAPSAYKGRNRFGLSFKNLQHQNEAIAVHTANLLWAFYKARRGSFEAFYFFNPFENPSRTGQVGKYLMRFIDSKLSRELFIWYLFNANLGLIEVRA